MATKIIGNDILVPGQVTIEGPPNALQKAITSFYSSRTKGFVKALDLNAAAPGDLATLTVFPSRYIPVAAWVYNPTANLALATLGLYTAAAGGGTAIITPTLLASLTGVDTFQELSISALSSVITAQTLYPRLTVASGTAGTAALVIEMIDLTLI